LVAAAAATVTLVVAAPRASADLAHVFDSTVTGDYDAATTWNPSTRFPIADAAPGTVTGDVAIVHGGTNIVTISADSGASQLYVGATLDYGGGTNGSAIVNQTAGTLTLHTAGTNAQNNWLIIGDRAGVTGTYNMTGGVINVTGFDALGVGQHGVGGFNVSGTSSVTAYNLFVGRWTDGNGTVNLSGSASMNFTNAYVGLQGNGSFNQTAGTLNVASGTTGLAIGYEATSNGTFTLSGGVLTAFNQFVGYSGRGSLTINGGTNTVNNFIALGFTPSASGSVSLISGTLDATHAGEDIGSFGGATGTFTQSGGLNRAFTVEVGGHGGNGTFTLSGGTLTIGNSVHVGDLGNGGVFNQSGGLHTIIGAIPGTSGLFIGSVGNLGAAYNLSGGLFNPGTVTLNTGTFSYSGGTLLANTYIQNGGAFAVTSPNGLVLAPGSASTASYTMNGGTLHVAGDAVVAQGGTATFEQFGGNAAVDGTLFGGQNPGSVFTINLHAGILTATNIVLSTLGAFQQFSTASNLAFGNFTQGPCNVFIGVGNVVDLDLNALVTSQPTYTMQLGAELLVSGNTYVGDRVLGTIRATFTENGGAFSVSKDLVLGRFQGNVGTFNQTDGSATIFGNAVVGSNGAGIVNQSLGTFVLAGTDSSLYIGYTNAGSGTFTLSSGNLLGTGRTVFAGYYANGVYNQSGGSANLGNLVAGGFTSTLPLNVSNGSVNLSGGTLQIGNTTAVGSNSTGTFLQTGGAHNFVTGSLGLVLGYNFPGSGTYTLAGGILNATNASIYVGLNGSGTYNQSGGTASTINFIAGYNGAGTTRSSGSVSLSDGTLTSINSFIAYNGSANFNQSGGTHSTGFLDLAGSSPSVVANYNMSNDATLNVKGDEYIGDQGLAGFGQNGGTHTMGTGAGSLYVGRAVTGSGDYYLNDGTFTAPNKTEYWGYFGAGGMNQQGGTHSLGNFAGGMLILAYTNTSLAFYNLNGGTLTGASVEIVANGGMATFSQLGNNTTGALDIGYNPNAGSNSVAHGTYTLNGGTLTVFSTTDIGDFATGAFIQNGGSHIIGSASNAGTLYVGSGPNPPPSSYSLTNGTLQVIGGTEYVGLLGNGSYNQSGGSNSAVSLDIGHFAGAGNGTVNLSGGSLTISGTTLVGNGGNGNFVQTGGTHTAGTLEIGQGATSAIYSLTNGTLTVLGDAFVGVGAVGHGIYNQSGGSATINGTLHTRPGTSGLLTLSGGTLVAGATDNQGTINQTGGTSSLGPVSGTTGVLQLGISAGASATANVTSFQQAQVLVRSAGALLVASNAARVNNTATSVTIFTGGLLDLANNDLTTSTPAATIRGYLTSAYTAGQDWSGRGLSSSFAKANPSKFTVGYANGSDQSAQDAGINVAAGKVLVAPVLVGDANMDGRVDFFDIAQLLAYKYNTGQAAAYTDGDLDYSGKVDFFDIATLLSGNYNTGEQFGPSSATAPARAAPTLTRGGAVASATTIGTTGDGKPDFEYNPLTGDLRFRSDGGAFTTTGGSASFVSSLTISSASGILLFGGASPAFAGGTGATLTSTLLSSALTNSPGFSDGFDIGIVLAPGLDAATLTADLTVKYQSLNGGSLKTADITVPEPTSWMVLGFSAAAGLANRHRKARRRR
jgi:hypothetical protein